MTISKSLVSPTQDNILRAVEGSRELMQEILVYQSPLFYFQSSVEDLLKLASTRVPLYQDILTATNMTDEQFLVALKECYKYTLEDYYTYPTSWKTEYPKRNADGSVVSTNAHFNFFRFRNGRNFWRPNRADLTEVPYFKDGERAYNKVWAGRIDEVLTYFKKYRLCGLDEENSLVYLILKPSQDEQLITDIQQFLKKNTLTNLNLSCRLYKGNAVITSNSFLYTITDDNSKSSQN